MFSRVSTLFALFACLLLSAHASPIAVPAADLVARGCMKPGAPACMRTATSSTVSATSSAPVATGTAVAQAEVTPAEDAAPLLARRGCLRPGQPGCARRRDVN